MATPPSTTSTSYTEKQVEEILRLRLAGVAYSDISAAMAKKFRLDVSVDACRGVFLRNGKLAKSLDVVHPYSEFTRDELNVVRRSKAKKAKFFITAASPVNDRSKKRRVDGIPVGTNLHAKGFETVLRACNYLGLELVLLPMRAHMPALSAQPKHYDPELWPYVEQFATEFIACPTLRALELNINPQQFDPLISLQRLRRGGRALADSLTAKMKRYDSSLIVAHTKQYREQVPTGLETPARVIRSTGCITVPEYLDDTRVGVIAESEHTLGGLIVEVDGTHFSCREVQIDGRTGEFATLVPEKAAVMRFYPDRAPTKERAEALKAGDIHPGFHDPVNLEAKGRLMDMAQPRRYFTEDWFDGSSISHHLERKVLSRAKLPECFRTLDAELETMRRVHLRIANMGPKDMELLATHSNHPEFLTRYLQEGRYAQDEVNIETAVRILGSYFRRTGEKRVTDSRAVFAEEMPPGWRILGPNEDYYVEGIQCSSHGHLPAGPGAQADAHTHAPRVKGQRVTAGHSTVPRHGYNEGQSKWGQADILIFKGGGRQLIDYVDGRFSHA